HAVGRHRLVGLEALLDLLHLRDGTEGDGRSARDREVHRTGLRARDAPALREPGAQLHRPSALTSARTSTRVRRPLRSSIVKVRGTRSPADNARVSPTSMMWKLPGFNSTRRPAGS